MNTSNTPTIPPSPLDEAIAAYLLALESGETPDRDSWVHGHPDVADGLRAFFADQDGFDRAAGPLRDAMDTLAAGDMPADVDGCVRYFGDYQLLEEIDRGGMGVVFKARQVSLGRPVALKMILSGQFAGTEDVRRFRDEASAAAGLDHPNIVPIYEIGEHDGRQYFSMKLIEGSSLRREMSTFRERSTEAARLMACVARAVHYAHQHGIIHRDLKPANILLDRKDQPHVTDFGLAKRFGMGVDAVRAHETQTGTVLGTPAYMSPEQAAGRHKEVSTSADVYSLGAILYEMITGRPPFGGDSALDILTQVKEAEPTHPRRINPGLNRDLEIICLKCLRKQPHLRYASAEALADDLERWLRGEPIIARSVGSFERSWRWCRRNPAVAGLVTAVVLTLILGVVVSAHFAIRANMKAKLAEAAALQAMANQHRADDKAAEALASANEARLQTAQARVEKDRADANAKRFGTDLYVADMRMAQRAWDEGGRVGRVLQLLDGQRPVNTVGVDLRGFEWHYLNRLCHTDILNLGTYGAGVVTFSPDGTRIAYGGTNQHLIIADARTGQIIFDMKRRHSAEISCVAFSPDGKRLASATGVFGLPSTVGEIWIWDASTGKEILKLKGHASSVTSIAFSPDGKNLLSAGGDNTVRFWDPATGDERFNIRTNTVVFGVAFSPDGNRFLTVSDNVALTGAPGEVKVWDTASRHEVFNCKGHIGRIISAAYSPDGKQFASGGTDGVRIWDAVSGNQTHVMPQGGNSIAFSRDGKRFASSDGAVRLWDASSFRELASMKGHVWRIASVAFSPDGKRIASADDWVVKIWDPTVTQEPTNLVRENDVNSWYTSTAFTPDGKRLVAAGFGPMRIWDVKSGAELRQINTGKKSMQCVALSPDGTHIAAGGEDNAIHLWDATTGEQTLSLTGHTSQVNGIAFSPDGKRIASVSGDGHSETVKPQIKVWDAASGNELLSFEGNSRKITSIVFSPDGMRLAGGITQYGIRNENGTEKEFISGEVQVWDAATGKSLFRLKDGHHVHSVAFSPDGTRIAGGGLTSGVKVWDAATQKLICTMTGHGAAVNGVTFSPDGKRVASVSEDGSLRVWDSTTGQEALMLHPGNERLLGVAFSPDGKRLAAAGGRTVRIWDASPPTSISVGPDGAVIPAVHE